ncbi:EXS_family protein [Hexamita inflata]|uniref:EXS family protein n=1 Tax=Hexamita inflata TaxID=28002 RepID=A0AA86P4Q8_9EUKA|nr:EXS family protein [Hexamita inflata]
MSQIEEPAAQPIVTEWAAQYVDTSQFEYLITKLSELADIEKKNQKSSNYNSILLGQMYNELENKFWMKMEKDLEKIDSFYQSELKTGTKRVQEIKAIINSNKLNQQQNLAIVEENVTETYRGLDLLINYCQQNALQIRKLVRHWDANNPHTQLGSQVIKNKLAQHAFSEPDEIEGLKEKLEAALALLLDVNIKEAKNKLTKVYSPTSNIKKKAKMQASCGIAIGITAVLFLAYCQVMFEWPRTEDIKLTMTASSTLLLRTQFTISFLIICYGLLVKLCEHTHINYIYLFEIPQTDHVTGSAEILVIGLTYWSIASVFGILAAASSAGAEHLIPLPFGNYISQLAVKLDPDFWVLLTTMLHFIVLYYSMLDIMNGQNAPLKHLMVVMYKTVTPWAHPVNIANFYCGTLTTSLVRAIKDVTKIITKSQANDFFLCALSAYPSLIRVMQCYIKSKPGRKFYPHLMNASINGLGIIGCFLTAGPIINKKGPLFWIIFCVRIVEITGKIYWDFCEDGGLFTGGTGVKEFKDKRTKWQYGHFCKRPSFVPLSWLVIHVVHNLISRLLWIPDVIWNKSPVLTDYIYVSTMALNEILRRYFWAFVRLDNQQATNCENYLATRYVPILLDDQPKKVVQMTENANAEIAQPERLSFVRPQTASTVMQRIGSTNATIGQDIFEDAKAAADEDSGLLHNNEFNSPSKLMQSIDYQKVEDLENLSDLLDDL